MRVKPVPIQLIHTLFAKALRINPPTSCCLGYMSYVIFYYLMRPGKYCPDVNDVHLFWL